MFVTSLCSSFRVGNKRELRLTRTLWQHRGPCDFLEILLAVWNSAPISFSTLNPCLCYLYCHLQEVTKASQEISTERRPAARSWDDVKPFLLMDSSLFLDFFLTQPHITVLVSRFFHRGLNISRHFISHTGSLTQICLFAWMKVTQGRGKTPHTEAAE